MSEINVVVSQNKLHWIRGELQSFFRELSSAQSTVTCSECPEIFNINVAFNKNFKNEVLAIIKKMVCNAYCLVAKKEYLEKCIPAVGIEKGKRDTLIRALVSFDSDNDRKIVLNALKIGKIFNVDGFYNFKLGLLRNSWDDLCVLAKENASFAPTSDSSFDLLLRFLLSTVEPKNETVSVTKKNDGYAVRNETEVELCSKMSAVELIDTLVDIAPVEIVCDETVVDGKLISRLNGIFELKRVNNLLYFCENKQ